jgi:hypothetical protein
MGRQIALFNSKMMTNNDKNNENNENDDRNNGNTGPCLD